MLLPALAAVSGGLAALPVDALELGELKVQSALGQPLRASIAFALAPQEQLSSSCISLQQGVPAGGLPAITRASMGVTDGIISLTGKTPIREPMLTMRVNINCPYTPSLSREYMLFVDPPSAATGPIADPAVTPTAVTPRAVAPATAAPAAVAPAAGQSRSQQAPSTARRPAVNRTPIADVSRYHVQRGDSLSVIAQRIENRSIGLWDAVAVIFEANPDAFMDNNPDKLKAGSWLVIPDLVSPQSSTVVNNELPTGESTQSGAADAGQEVTEGTAYTGAAEFEFEQPTAIDQSATTEIDSSLLESQSSDVTVEADNPFVAPVGSNVVETIILDTQLDSPDLGTSPNGATISIQSPSPETSSSNWLWWLAGSGFGIIAALLLFGRRFRGRFGSAPIGAVAVDRSPVQADPVQADPVQADPVQADPVQAELPQQPDRRLSEKDTAEVEAISDLDFGLSDDTPTEENLLLDADLVEGTGLSKAVDMQVAQDFGFAATTEIDTVLPKDSSDSAPSDATARLPALRVDEHTILDSEVLPGDEDYDMSVIVDATKIQNPEDATAQDLMAITIETGVLETGVFQEDDDTLISGSYTVTQEAELDILQQDYQNEMTDYQNELTATQMLNEEISKATVDLADRMDGEIDDPDATSLMQLASVTELELTTDSDGDDTSIREGQTAEFLVDEKTVEMPANDADVTVEMPAKSSKRDSKAS